jgi:uncharacterized protein YkwD
VGHYSTVFQTALLAALACEAFAATDLYDAVNRIRAGEGACRVVQKQAPLTRQPALERAARALAGGRPLRESLKEAGYRATASRYIGITGSVTVSQAVAVLERKYCEPLLDGALAEIGIHHDAGRLLIVMAAPFAPRVMLSPEAAAQRVLELVNDARTQPRRCGERSFGAVRPVSRSAVLGKAASMHAEDMARHNFFSHTGHDGSSVAERVRRVGYRFRTAGENIAAGTTTPEEAVAGWIKSPGHCANLMNPAFSEMGVAFAVERNSRFGVYWAQVFATPR